MMYSLSFKIAFLTLATSVLSSSSIAEVTIVESGKTGCMIVLPEKTELERLIEKTAFEDLQKSGISRLPDPNDLRKAAKTLNTRSQMQSVHNRLQDEELLAAQELQEFIKKISGIELKIRRAVPGEITNNSAIILGSELAAKAGYSNEIDSLDKDGILLKTQGNHVILAGKRARGTLYAAYDFLESIGVYWVMPGKFGEIYPQQSTIKTNVNKVENPDHSKRYWWNSEGQGEEFLQWSLRNKGNLVGTLGDQQVAQHHALADPLKWGAKNPKYGIKVKKMIKEHQLDPNSGKPIKDPNGQPVLKMVEKEFDELPAEYYAVYNNEEIYKIPNMSNPKVWDLYADYYIDYFNKYPEKDYVSVSAEDMLIRDSRKESRDISSNEFDWIMGEYSATDRTWYFLNRVIDKVIKVYPNKKFGVLIYANNMAPPRLERVHPNMALVYAPLSICPLHHVRDAKCKTNRTYHEWLESWAAQAKTVGAESYYYDYFPLGFQWNVATICPQWSIIGKNYPYFHKLGLTGHTTEGHDDWGASHFTNWVAIRLYWKADQDYKEILKHYCQIRFGKEAAPAVLEYCDILEKRMEEIPDLCGNEIWGNHLVLTPAVREKCRKALNKAAQFVKGDHQKAHLQTLIDMQTSTDAWCDGIEIARNEGDFAKAMKVMDKSFEIKDKLNAIYSHFVAPRRMDKNSDEFFQSGGWYKKYKIFNDKISAASSFVILPKEMKVALDTDNTAWTKGWQNPEVSVSELESWDCTQVPDIKYGTDREVAGFFYRCEVAIPRDFNTKQASIYFPSIIARALQIWVNGKPVSFTQNGLKDTIYRGHLYFWDDYNHQLEFNINQMLEAGKVNTIAFRIFKIYDHAGTYDRVFLLGK